jgi:molybdate transport system ATP-binding protein
MTLDAHLVVQRGQFTVDVAFAVADGEVLGMLGPNGAGKTTALRALAGLEPLTDGYVRLDGETIADTGHSTPPEDRNIGVVFQDYLLFPHLTALDNVAYGLRAGGMRKAAARRDAAGWLEQVGLTDHAGHRPRQLSGGQGQRVALARALAARPRLLLLDEPLAALDAGTRLVLRSELRRHLTSYGGPAVVVTHDAVEALVLTDNLVVLEGGRIVQSGPPAEVARRPRTEYVARLLGLNLYRGTARDGWVDLDGGGRLALAEKASGEVHVAIRPSAVALHRARPEQSSPRNVWAGRVTGVEAVGDRVRVALAGQPDVLADVTTDSVTELDLAAGAHIWMSVKATELAVYPV